nr:exocyst complex component SEC10-like [Tanacetum cinerariifolium]
MTEVHEFGRIFLGYWVKYKVTSMIGHVSRLLLPVDGAHAASCEETAKAMSSAEGAAYKGLQQCIETVMDEVERLLSVKQKATNYKSPDDGIIPDDPPTNTRIRGTAGTKA